jgi:hypothetical protein
MNDYNYEQSEFNDAIGYLGRINAWFYSAGNAALNMNAPLWFSSLINIYRELSTEMKEEEHKKHDATMMSINLSINSYKHTDGINGDVYMSLHQWEIDLRNVFKRSGLQNKMKDDASKALR